MMSTLGAHRGGLQGPGVRAEPMSRRNARDYEQGKRGAELGAVGGRGQTLLTSGGPSDPPQAGGARARRRTSVCCANACEGLRASWSEFRDMFLSDLRVEKPAGIEGEAEHV